MRQLKQRGQIATISSYCLVVLLRTTL